MAFLPLDKKFNPDFAIPGKKPVGGHYEIDKSNPITRGLKTYLHLNEKGTTARNLVDGSVRTIGGSTYVWEVDGWKQTTSSTTSSNIPFFTATDEGSLVLRYTPSSLYNFNSIFDTDSNENDFEGWIYSDGRLHVKRAQADSRPEITGVSAGDYLKLGFSWKKGEAASGNKLYLDGTLRGETSSDATSVTGQVYLNSGNTGNTGGIGKYDFAMQFDRRLTDAEQLSLALDPYQVLKPVTQTGYFTASAVAASSPKFFPLPKKFNPDFAIPNKKPVTDVGSISIADDWKGRILHAWMPTHGSRLYDVANNKFLSVPGGNTQVGKQGLVVDTAKTSIATRADITNIDKARGCHVVCMSPDVLNTTHYIFDSTGSRQLAFFSSSGFLTYFANGSTKATKSLSGFVAAGDYINVVFEWPSSRIWINGKLFVDGTDSSISGIGTELTLWTRFGNTESLDGKRVFFATVNGPCNGQSLSADPYQVLKPVTQTGYFTPSEVVGGLVVQDLSVSTSLTSPSLTQHNALAVDNLAVSTTLTEPVLSQHNALVAQNLAVGTSLTEPALTQNFALSTNDLAVGTSLTSPALTQHHALSVDNLAVGTTLSNVTLVIAGVLAVQDLSVGTTISSPALDQHNILVVDNLAVSSTLTEPALTQHNALAVDNLAVGTTITNAILNTGISLLVQNLAVGTVVSVPTLTQHNTLIVDDLDVQTLLSNVTLSGAAIGCLNGRVVLAQLLDGKVTITPLLGGNITIH